MTSRSFIEVEADTLEAMAFKSGLPIEPDVARGLMFMRVGNATFAAPLNEVPC